MKFIVIVSILLTIFHKTVANEYDGVMNKMQNLMLACAKEENVKQEELGTLWKLNNPKIGCVIRCTMKKRGMWKNDKIDKEAILKSFEEEKNGAKVPEELVLKFARCIDKGNQETDECRKALSMVKCTEKP